MASTLNHLLLLLLITVTNTVTVTAVPEREYYSLLSALRNRGYHVFANAIATTDLHYDIISGANFTFFTPIDSVLYNLDMSLSAADYTTTLRFHVVPHRLSLSDLRNLPYGLSSFPTLLRDHHIHVVNPLSLPLPITVEGVGIAVPDLYYDSHIAVHGLESIIEFRSLNDTVKSTLFGEDVTDDLTPIDVRREVHAPAPQFSDLAVNSRPHSSVVTGINTVASAIQQHQQHRQPVSKSESIVQSHHSPEMYFESVTQPLEKHESVTQPTEEHVSIATRSGFNPQKIHHVSLAKRSSGDANAVEEFTQVDDMNIDCPIVTDDDEREEMSIANLRRGDHYARELYTPTKMTCAPE